LDKELEDLRNLNSKLRNENNRYKKSNDDLGDKLDQIISKSMDDNTKNENMKYLEKDLLQKENRIKQQDQKIDEMSKIAQDLRKENQK